MNNFYRYFVLIVILVSSNFSIKSESWNDAGNYDISWYTKDPDIYISSPEELAGVAYLVNNNFTDFAHQTIHLVSDIDLSGKTWIPIGHSFTFRGGFDGHGYSITGVSITNFDGIQGFFGKMSDGTICSLKLNASINTNRVKSGVLVAEASGCTFQDLTIMGSIVYVNKTISASTSWNTTIYNGGVVGVAADCTFTDVISEFDQSLVFGESGGSSCFGYFSLYSGSIVGYGSSTNNFLRCEGISSFYNTVYGYNASDYYTSHGVTKIYCGGIVGSDLSSNSTFVSCLSKIKRNNGSHLTGVYDTVSFYTMGFGSLYGKIENCVAIIDSYNITGHDYSWVASWYHTNTYLNDCGVVATPLNIGGCYVNRDISQFVSKVKNNESDFLSSTSYTKEQMNTQAFVDELNIYSKINMDGEENWKLENGVLVLKHNKYNYSGVANVDAEISDKSIEYYTLQGIRVLSPSSPGIYICRKGSKVMKIQY